MVFANATLGQQIDGLQYALNVPLTTTEADLSSFPAQPNLDPRSVQYCQAFVASVLFTVQGNPGTMQAYVVAQGSNDNQNWFDLAWCVTTLSAGTALFALCGGQNFANAFQQTRSPGTAPSSTGSNSVVIPGLLRFVGKAVSVPPAGTSSSSSSARSSSASPLSGAILASISLKLLGLR